MFGEEPVVTKLESGVDLELDIANLPAGERERGWLALKTKHSFSVTPMTKQEIRNLIDQLDELQAQVDEDEA